MYAKTHMLMGGVVGYLISPTWLGVLGGIGSALISDIDEPKSFIGRRVFLISIPLNWTMKHRTVTHSLFFSILFSCLFVISALILSIFTDATPIFTLSYVVFGGILSHILGDMVTGRVSLLWPLYRKKIGIKVPFWLYRVIDMLFRLALVYLIINNLIFGDVINNLLKNKLF